MLASGFSVSYAAGITLTDDLGREVRLAQPARRIATLAPFLTELAFSVGAGGDVVAASAHSDYPPPARALPRVSSAAGIDVERLAAVRPDLVVAWRDAIRGDEIERLGRFGIPVFVAQARSLEDVPRLADALARLAGRDATGPVRAYREKLRALRAAHAAMPPLRVFAEIWHQPLTTIAGAHWINEALAVCGARNAFADLPGIAPAVPWETVYARDPAVIVGAGSAATAAEFRARWSRHAALAAVRAGRLVFVDPDLVQRPTLRLAEGVAQLCEGLDRIR